MFTKNSKRFLSLLIVSTLLFSFTNPVYQTNFSGTWTLNEGKSDLGQFGGRGVASKLVIDQKSDGVTVTRHSNMQGQAVVTTEAMSNDGKETETTLSPNAKKKASLKWAADGQTLTITYSIAFDNNGQTFELKGTENWSLGADGKSLTLQNSLSTPNGDIAIKAAYDKQ